MNNWLDQARRELASKIIDQGVHYRILFIGRSVNGTTDIVSCLSRSLRNLGHHVLDIDLKRHRGITDNPKKVAGGHGPIYIKPAAFDQICAQFTPQIVIFCAGGLVLYPEHADLVKKRGIVLVGITLSDPDVFPTVHPHVHVFDFHTTNARHALDMYKEAGVHNTVYFPFGIDRGFITQAVAHAPELAADVICMGHATGRPERNSVMRALARQFDVKTYGRGWELAGSEPVAGARMVQAMRAGKIHINFPLTRAGYVNIKCGVFESVGAGALLCTARFDEMSSFFKYDEEIVGYEGEADLAEQLDAIIRSPDRYRRMTEAAFARLANEHLYEHRWMSLFETAFNCSADSTYWLDESRIRSIRTTLARSYERTKHVLLSGFYGASNLGDELILRSIQTRLAKADSSVQVTVACENPFNIERDHGLQAFSRKNLNDALHHCRTTSAIVVGGGGLWHDYTFSRSGGLLGIFQEPQISMAGFAALPMLGRFFDAPCHVVGMGVGPMSDPEAFRMLRFVAGMADTIYVRDDESLALLEMARISQGKAFKAPDVVYALELPEADAPESLSQLKAQGYTLLALNLRPWAKFDEDELLAKLVRAVKGATGSTKLALVTVPMQAGPTLDESMLNRFVRKFGASTHAVHFKAPLSFERLVGVLAGCDLLLSMRLHACLLAHRLRKPVVGIAYDPKVTSHFEQIGRSEFCLPLAESGESFERAVKAALLEFGKLPGAVGRHLSKLEARAQEAMNVSAQRIAALPRADRVFEVPKEVDTLRGTISSLGTQLEACMKARRDDTVLALCIASMSNLSFKAVGLDGSQIDVLANAAKSTVTLCLPTDEPKAGQAVTCDGVLDFADSAGEIELALDTNYARQNFEKRIVVTLQVEEIQLAVDLAEEKGPIKIRVGLPEGKSNAKFRVSIIVLKDCFKSRAWPRATTISLTVNLEFASVVRRKGGTSLMASRGSLTKRAFPAVDSDR